MEPTLVTDDEIVFRRVLCDPMCFRTEPDGRLVPEPAAFNDRKMRPSVDRKSLRPDPKATQRGPEEKDGWERAGVVRLVVAKIRGAKGIAKMKGQEVEVQHQIDVIHVPNPPADPKNDSHAHVQPSPAITSDKVFRRLREALARLVDDWEIRPDGYR